MRTSSNDEHLGGTPVLLPLAALIAARAFAAPDAPAIEAVGAEPLRNLDLHELSENTRIALRCMGLGGTARIAVTAPAGPEFAAATAAIAANATCAPLSPGLGTTALRKMLTHLRIDALVAPEACAVAREAAESLGLPVLCLHPTPDRGAGAYTLDGAASHKSKGAAEDVPGLDDVAFVLPTSGTTSQPKVVPLTHRNIAHSGRNTGEALMLTEEDRLIGVLPIYHAHGLISGLMATLYAGASIIMMRGFSADSFFDHLSYFRPTWLTAVPAIHQAILDAAPAHRAALEGHELRLVRSASAPLPGERYQALADLFGVPVIETYGMTEAASQIASNPLDGWWRKPGSVGKAAGPEIMILGEDDAPQPPGVIGEVALCGPNMTLGYDDPMATAAAFTKDGWFRTGDLGRLDKDSCLYIVGRLKEVINRGGEKILPGRIEAVLTRHRSVAEAAAFGAPHGLLGEDVAVAVVATDGAEIDEIELRAFALASGELSEAEVPRLIISVKALSKTMTGKVQRALLAENLGLKTPAAEPATTEDETTIVAIWREVMGLETIGATDDFFHLGGDSLMAVEIALRIAEAFDVKLTLRSLFEASTPQALAAAVHKAALETTGFQIEKAPQGAMLKPISISQERILLLEAALPGLPTYTVPIVYFIDGPFAPIVFERALRTLIARHEVFRTIFRKVAGEWKAIPTAAVNLRLPVEDWRWAATMRREDFINDALENEIWDVLNPTKSAPLRTRLLKFDEDSHALVLIFHHIAMDNWTIRTFVEEVLQHYGDMIAEGDLSRPRPTFQFAEFADWQRRWAEGDEAALQRAYWLDHLAGLKSIFPVDDRHGPTGVSFSAERADVAISKEVVDVLARRSQAAGATLFMGLVAALKVFLHQKFHRSDIAIVAPTANRSRPATGDVLGLIANNAAIRTSVAATGFNARLAAVRNAVLDADAHQELPFEFVMDDLTAADPVAAAALSDVYLSLVDHFEPEIADVGLTLYRMEHSQAFEMPLPIGAAKLALLLRVVDGAIIGSCIFKAHLISWEDAQNLVDEFIECIPGIVAPIDSAPIV